MEKNLIEKLASKWADFKYAVSHSKIAKRVATLMLAGAMAVPVVLSASACKVTIKDNGDGSYTVTPNPDDNTGNNQGNQQGGNNQGNTEKPAPDYSKYSPLLQSVLTDPEYDELYSRYESGELYEESMRFDTGSNLLEAIPYDYLADKGEDIAGIKNGAVRVNSELYTIDNEPNYIYDKIDITYKVDNGENYINQYLLKYKISEQELKDLTMLYNGKYYQGPVMFQKLASQQQPQVIAEFSLTEKAYKEIINVCNATNQWAVLPKLLNYDKISNFTLTSLDYGTFKDNQSYDITFNLINEGNSNDSVSHKTIYKFSASLIYASSKVNYSNQILDLTDFNALNSKLLESTPITYFKLYTNFKNVKTTLN